MTKRVHRVPLPEMLCKIQLPFGSIICSASTVKVWGGSGSETGSRETTRVELIVIADFDGRVGFEEHTIHVVSFGQGLDNVEFKFIDLISINKTEFLVLEIL